ncbi:MAG: c-type cytochrome [Anaerolineae bacterium]|jgi:mono/diheme cytochrome c family protein
MYRPRWMLVSVSLMAALLLGAACTPNPQPQGLTPVPTLAPGATALPVPSVEALAAGGAQLTLPAQASAAQGATLYPLFCTPCHGVRGQGADASPLRNSQVIQTVGDQSLFYTLADGLPGTAMPAWLLANGGPLTDAEISNVVAYLHTMQGVQPDAPIAPNAGGPGQAASMSGDAEQGRSDFGLYCALCHGPEGVQGLANPGSDRGSVPPVNPIGPRIMTGDPNTFATNLDLYLEHGSIPAGPDPLLLMPPYGDRDMLSQEQIANLIAYILQVNGIVE